MLTDSQGRRLWVVDEFGRHTPVESHNDIQSRPRGGAGPDWWVVAKDQAWTPPEPRSLLNLGATDSGSAAAGGDSGGGMKIGAGHKPQPYGWHGYYGGAGGGSVPGPVYRGKVTLPNEVRGKVTSPVQTGKEAPPPPPAPRQPHLTYGQGSGKIAGPDGDPVAKGYAGRDGGLNNPDAEGDKGVGPIPQGNWRMEEVDEQTCKRNGWPPPAFKLTPDEETRKRVEALGRDPESFYIHAQAREVAKKGHGDSKGCIALDTIGRGALKKFNGRWLCVER